MNDRICRMANGVDELIGDGGEEQHNEGVGDVVDELLSGGWDE